MSRQGKRPQKGQYQPKNDVVYVVKDQGTQNQQQQVEVQQQTQETSTEQNHDKQISHNSNSYQKQDRSYQQKRNYQNEDNYRDEYNQDQGRNNYTGDNQRNDYKDKPKDKTSYKNSQDKNDNNKKQQDTNKDRPHYQQQKKPPIAEEYKREKYSDEEYYEEESKDAFDITQIQQKELTDVLIKMFKRKKVVCPICYVRIHSEAKIWNCKQCSSPYHLACMHKWIKNTNSTQNQVLYNWSCPKCNFLYSEEMPQYYCFCGYEKNPDINRYTIPHACGGRCNKKRGKYCQHPCPMDCHPGPCPECTVKGLIIQCYCGNNKKQISCSEDITAYPCQSVCSKELNCKQHTCSKMCHPGACSDCPIKYKIKCHCGDLEQEVDCGTKTFSCNNPCGQTLDCGNHICESKKCHEYNQSLYSRSCLPCDKKPELVKTCPCQKFQLEMILSVPRTLCTDPIPSCGTPIEKTQNCGHKVRTICGSKLPKCNQKVIQPCRCSSNQQMVECWVLQENSTFICDKVCKKKKTCKIHTCGVECCPANKGDDQQILHYCFKECSKPLPCGNHNCGLYCHIGACQSCPILILQPLACYCGRTLKNPPNKCGAKPPDCHEVCQKDLPNCEHKCQSQCHPPPCHKCQEVIQKECRCKKTTSNIECFKVLCCKEKCLKSLPCGHICQDICPSTESQCNAIENGCTQRCSKKLFCDHPCPHLCHLGKDCPKEPCKTQIRVKCDCGNREAFIDCGVIDEPLEKTLKCDAKCANIKRFGSFCNTSSQMVDLKKVYYPSILMKFANYNMVYLQKLEQRIEDFLFNTENLNYCFQFGKTEWSELKKTALQILLSRHYKLDVQLERMQGGGYSFTVNKTNDTTNPKPKLSDYFVKVQKGQIHREGSAFEAKLKTQSNLSQHDIDQLEGQIKEYKNDYYIERQNGQLIINFWEQKQAEDVLRRIKKIVGYSQLQWLLELNVQVIDEQQKITINSQDEVVVKPGKPKKPIQQEQFEDQDLSLTYKKENILKFKLLDQRFQNVACNLFMCSEEEIQQRSAQEDLDIFEQDPFYVNEIRARNEWMIRKYNRGGIGSTKLSTPTYVRSPSCLIKTVDYIIENVIDADSYEHFKEPIENGKSRKINFHDIHNFTNDRLQQVRAELNFIGTQEFVEGEIILIQCLKYYILALVEDIDQKENLIIIQKLLSQMKELDSGNNKQILKYQLIVATFTDQDITELVVGSGQNNKLVDICISFKTGDLLPFFKYFQTNKNYLIACLLHIFIQKIRMQQTNKFQDSMITMDLEEFTDVLAFDDQDQAIEFLKLIGVDLTKTLEEINSRIEVQQKQQEQEEQKDYIVKPLIYWNKRKIIKTIPMFKSKRLEVLRNKNSRKFYIENQ